MASIDLRLGRWRVGVRPDTDSTRRALADLLGAYLDPSGEPTRTNFSVRANRRRRARHGASLHVAGELVLADGSLATVAERLAGHLAGVAVDTGGDPGPNRAVVEGRVVARGQRALLVLAPCVGSLDVTGAGITEVALWHPVVDTGTMEVVVPPPLERLDWRAAGLARPSSATHAGAAAGDRLELAGVVSPADPDGGADLARMWFSARGDLDGWGLVLAHLEQSGRVEAAPATSDVLPAVARLLGGVELAE